MGKTAGGSTARYCVFPFRTGQILVLSGASGLPKTYWPDQFLADGKTRLAENLTACDNIRTMEGVRRCDPCRQTARSPCPNPVSRSRVGWAVCRKAIDVPNSRSSSDSPIVCGRWRAAISTSVSAVWLTLTMCFNRPSGVSSWAMPKGDSNCRTGMDCGGCWP